MAPHDWALDYAAVGIEPPATVEELAQADSYAEPALPAVVVDPDEVAAHAFLDVNLWDLSGRERDIYEAGFFAGHLARQHEVDAANNAAKRSESDADRFYRAAFDHDYHDCAVHRNRGKYQGAATRFADDAWR